jgi:cation:H+ antiporter
VSVSDRRQRAAVPVCALILLSAGTIPEVDPSSVLWTTPSLLAAAMLIAWAGESAQFFIAQGFALAILAWLQTLPEFAVEAVLAWKQQVPLLMANLTGALRLLTGLGWPMIYFTAALFHRSRKNEPLRRIKLADEHCIEVIGLLAAMGYAALVWAKASLDLVDAAVLIGIYLAYLAVLQRMPPVGEESIDQLERIPRAIVTARRGIGIGLITALFVAGGGLIYFMAEPFREPVGSLSLARGSELRLHPVGGALRVGVSGKGFCLLLGAHGGPCFHRPDEHGLEQHQPVDPVGGHAAHHLFAQSRRR